MFETIRTEFRLGLQNDFTERQLEKILYQFDKVLSNYSLEKKETAVAVYTDYFPDELKLYLASIQIAGYSANSVTVFTGILKNFFRMIRKPLPEITASDIRMFFYYKKTNDSISDRTLSLYQSCIKSFFKWCCMEEILTKNPTDVLRPIKYEKTKRGFLTQNELERIRAVCITPREKAIVEFLYSTGCRVSEMSKVKMEDLDLVNGKVLLKGKGKKQRYSYLNAKCLFAIETYAPERDPNCEYLFQSVYHPKTRLGTRTFQKIIKTLVESSGITKNCSPHTFRHTTATTALMNGMPVDEISKLLGHESIATTLIYAETNESKLKADHERMII